MPDQLLARLRNLLHGFWLVPGAVALIVALLGQLLLEIDESTGEDGAGLFPGDADAARVVLSVVAGSLITVSGLVFSLTIVTLQLVSSEYTPRALRPLLGDTINQVVAGAFVGIIAYCLLVLRSVREDFVPTLALTGAIVLGLTGLALLLVFVHHVGRSIKVDEILARLARDTLRAADRLYPEPFGQPDSAPQALAGPASFVRTDQAGWLRAVAVDRLAERLRDAESVEILVAPGDFITPARHVAAVRPPTASAAAAAAAFEIARERDFQQDVGFGIGLLADIAVRALSPGVNDPTTAVTSIGYLGAVLERLAGKAWPQRDRRIGERELLVRAAGQSFEGLLQSAFLQIGRYGQDDPRVVAATLEALARVARVAADVGAADRLNSVRAVAEEVAGPAINRARTENERMLLDRIVQRVRLVSAGAVA